MDKLTLGEKIRFFRKRLNLSQMDLEDLMFASNGTISRIESDRVNPTKETIGIIASALKLNMIEKAFLFDIDVSEILTSDSVKVLTSANIEQGMFWDRILNNQHPITKTNDQ
jgi:transcriptional regulator with XRE-family HTH domain